MIVTAHRPNYLAGTSVLAKIARADAVVWLDDVRFNAPGWINRNRLPDGSWLTVPIERESHRSTIREVTLGEETGWRTGHPEALRELYRDAAFFDPSLLDVYSSPAAEPGQSLADFNLLLLDRIMRALGMPQRQFRQNDYPTPGGGLGSKLVRMVKAVGGTAYLSRPDERLDPAQFEAAGVELLFFRYAGDNPSIIDPLFCSGQLPSGPLQEVNVA